MAEKSRQSFGEQAARFSLYVPLVAFFIGAFSNAPGAQRSVALSLAWLSKGLIVAGLGLGIAALLSMRRDGRQGILVRAIIGVVVNALITLAMIGLALMELSAAHIRQQMPGNWVLEPTAAEVYQSATLNLHADGTFRFDYVKRGGIPLSVGGTWDVDRGRVLELTAEQGAIGNPTNAGTKIRVGRVRSVNPKQLILSTDAGQDVFDQAP